MDVAASDCRVDGRRLSGVAVEIPLRTRDALSLGKIPWGPIGSGPEDSSSESEDNESTLLFFRSEFENALVLV